MITKVHTVSLYVRDQQRAKEFYVDTLGFDVTADADMGPLGRWLEVAPKGAQTAFMLADAAAFDKEDRIGDSADLTLRCDDVQALHADLVSKGVPVTDPKTEPWGTFVTLTDPDGHELPVAQQ